MTPQDAPAQTLRAPFQFFGGKREIADLIWTRLGTPKQYLEPFCGSAAVLLAAPQVASLEVVNDINGFIANFWRAVKCQPAAVAEAADYPVSHIDLGARHVWLMAQRDRIGAELQDCEWPGDAKVAGYWLWGQCSWIGSGWCEWNRTAPGCAKPHQIPHVSNAGMGVQAAGQIPFLSAPGAGILALPEDSARASLMTSGGRTAWDWLHQLAARLERVRVLHGDWTRCLNHSYGATNTAVFLDPPYRAFEALYHCQGVADAVEAWARDNVDLRICLCGHDGDYDLPGWDVVAWKRPRLTYSGGDTTDAERLWLSPACLPSSRMVQGVLL